MPQISLDWEAFQRRFDLSDLDERLEKANLHRDGLQAIYEHHCQRSPELEDVAISVARHLGRLEEVHSTRTRVKEADHLVEKIIRKRCDKLLPTITVDNYTREITDLVGVRALHLLKSEWVGIHDFILGTWKLREKPQANYRRGDPGEVVERFKSKGCKAKEHPFGYRSVHYLVKCKPAKTEHIVEVQVRTIFEEGWSEIDHRVRYPRGAGPALEQFLVLFNRLAGSADEMGSFVGCLETTMQDYQEKMEEQKHRIDQLRNTIDRLPTDAIEGETLRRIVGLLSDILVESGVRPSDVTALSLNFVPDEALKLSITKV
jgi:putative GTP pyrophosphokinase